MSDALTGVQAVLGAADRWNAHVVGITGQVRGDLRFRHQPAEASLHLIADSACPDYGHGVVWYVFPKVVGKPSGIRRNPFIT